MNVDTTCPPKFQYAIASSPCQASFSHSEIPNRQPLNHQGGYQTTINTHLRIPLCQHSVLGNLCQHLVLDNLFQHLVLVNLCQHLVLGNLCQHLVSGNLRSYGLEACHAQPPMFVSVVSNSLRQVILTRIATASWSTGAPTTSWLRARRWKA